MQEVQLREAALESPLLHLPEVYSAHGPPLSMGKQLRRLLQLEILPIVLGLRGPRVVPRAGTDGLARHVVHGPELSPIFDVPSQCSPLCGRIISCRPVRTIRHYNVLRLNGVHTREHFYCR